MESKTKKFLKKALPGAEVGSSTVSKEGDLPLQISVTPQFTGVYRLAISPTPALVLRSSRGPTGQLTPHSVAFTKPLWFWPHGLKSKGMVPKPHYHPHGGGYDTGFQELADIKTFTPGQCRQRTKPIVLSLSI